MIGGVSSAQQRRRSHSAKASDPLKKPDFECFGFTLWDGPVGLVSGRRRRRRVGRRTFEDATKYWKMQPVVHSTESFRVEQGGNLAGSRPDDTSSKVAQNKGGSAMNMDP